jgi:hypothetical protein
MTSSIRGEHGSFGNWANGLNLLEIYGQTHGFMGDISNYIELVVGSYKPKISGLHHLCQRSP